MNIGIISMLIIVVTSFVSWKGFRDQHFFNGYQFEVEKVLVYKDYKRIVTSGFLHVNWLHLLFNMFSLYAFSGTLETYLGPFRFILIYFAGLIGGNLFSLFIHRHHGEYSSVGASGAISAVIFASIALFPGMDISFFGLPIYIPAWLYGLAFVLFSIYGIHSKRDNIGHDAHLAGALVGLFIAIIFKPSAIIENYLPIMVIAIPSIVFIYIIVTRPGLLLVDNQFFKAQNDFYSIDHRYNAEKHIRQKEVDRILDKIHKRGMGSLSRKEKELLKRYSEGIK